jgi:predicted RNA binding protein YcfA (HicA-like mRNA interferase family)
MPRNRRSRCSGTRDHDGVDQVITMGGMRNLPGRLMNWPSTKARRVLSALLRIGWSIKRHSGSHRTLSRKGWPDFVFALHDDEVIGPLERVPRGCRPGPKPFVASLETRRHLGARQPVASLLGPSAPTASRGGLLGRNEAGAIADRPRAARRRRQGDRCLRSIELNSISPPENDGTRPPPIGQVPDRRDALWQGRPLLLAGVCCQPLPDEVLHDALDGRRAVLV